MAKINALEIGLESNNDAATTYILTNITSNAKCKFTKSEKGKGKINFEIELSDGIEKLEIDLNEIKKASKDKCYLVLDVNDTDIIPLNFTDNNIRFTNDMDKTQLTLTFTLAGKAGGTTSGKAGGTTKAQIIKN